MAKREVQEINAGSMADIAFLLLIFFLVTTTMDVDTGIARKLPPIVENQKQEEQKIKERNIFIVLVNAQNDLLVEGQPMDISQLREKAKEFLANPNDDVTLPEKDIKNIPFYGEVGISKGVISLQNDRGTSFGTYIKVQNELTAAVNELRDQAAMQQFGKKLDDLKSEEADAVRMYIPMSISEAEPKNVGGKK